MKTRWNKSWEMKTICSHRIRHKSGVMWSVLLPD
ncbi:hypothetical protein ECH7EC4401_0536, partial [Escherichia coli O157:H7 str. EC4401]